MSPRTEGAAWQARDTSRHLPHHPTGTGRCRGPVRDWSIECSAARRAMRRSPESLHVVQLQELGRQDA